MHKIKILSVGKAKESWLESALAEYQNRLSSIAKIEWALFKTEEAFQAALAKETTYLALDPKGKAFTSEEFSSFLEKQLIQEGSRLTCVIGGAEGLTSEARNRASALISLSRLTFTHQMTRLVLVEQIYRAFEIQKGSSYHK